MRFPLLLLLALVAAAQDPADEAPERSEEMPPASLESLPDAPAPSVPAVQVARTGGQLLADATVALGEQRFEDALEIAIPAITTHPELGGSFEALALLATDQLARQAAGALAASLPIAQPQPQANYAPQPPAYPVRGIGVSPYPEASPPGAEPYPYRQRGAHFGVDLGLPTGLRVEWKTRRKEAAVSGGGLRLGVNAMVYYGLYAGYDLMGYVDVRAVDNWEVELMGGVTAYSGIYPWPMVGAALQYDPEGPLQVNVGGRIGLYRAFSPDVGVGFLW